MDDNTRKKLLALKNNWNREEFKQPERRLNELRDIENGLADAQGRDRVAVFDMKPMGAGYHGTYNAKTNELYLNKFALEEDTPSEAIQVTLHEGRHAYQDFATEKPGFHPDEAQVNQWRDELAHPKDPGKEFDKYETQSTETDARDYSEFQMKQLGLETIEELETKKFEALKKSENQNETQAKSQNSQENAINEPEEKKEEETEDYGMGM